MTAKRSPQEESTQTEAAKVFVCPICGCPYTKSRSSLILYMNSKTQPGKNWGGKRLGAGCPGEGRVTVCARIGIELAQRLKQAAKEQDTTLSNVIEMLLSTAVERVLRNSAMSEDHQGKLCSDQFSERRPEIRRVKGQGGREENPRRSPRHFIKKDHESRIEIDAVKLLNHLLKQNGLSREDLAQILELDEASAARILEGTRSITPVDAGRLGEQFNLRAALFLGREYRPADGQAGFIKNDFGLPPRYIASQSLGR